MASMPKEPEAFAECVAEMLRRLQPEYAIDLVGPRELLVNGRRLDLENLYRMVNHEPNRGTEIVEHYLEQLFAGEAIQLGTMTFDFARPRIMPRIQPESIFEHLSREQVAHVPWVNDTVIVFVTDLPHMTVSITTEQLLRWNVSVDEILLMTDLYSRLAPQLGGDFFVATPARDMFVAFSRGPRPFIDRLRERVDSDYRRLPYPICNDFFFVTRDGVAGTKPMRMGEAA